MGIFNWKKFPYTNFHELNLDYFINKFNKIFEEWENLYNTLNTWKGETTSELEEWKTATEQELDDKETALLQELNEWKTTLESDWDTWRTNTNTLIFQWENQVLIALNEWKTATTAAFEEIRTQAANSATSAANSATSAANSATSAANSASGIAASAAQITENTNDIADLKNSVIEINNELFEGEPIVITSYVQGTKRLDGSVNDISTRCSTQYLYPLVAGDKISISNVDNGLKAAITGTNGVNFISASGWQTVNFTYTVTSSTEGQYFVSVAKIDDTQNISPSDIHSLKVTVGEKESVIDTINDELDMIDSALNDGGFTTTEYIQGTRYANGSINNINYRVCTKNTYNLTAGDTIAVKNLDSGLKYGFVGYANGNFVHLTSALTEDSVYTVTSDTEGTYFVSFGKTDDTALTPSDISTSKVIIGEYKFLNKINNIGNEESELRSRYNGKKISIIGDSIDTFNQDGYKISGYRMYYPADGVTNVDQTWWMQVINNSGAKLEVNASWSGSRVTDTHSDPTYPDFYDRIALIGNPDIVFVTLGTNDSYNNVELGEYDFDTVYTSLSESTFRTAYIKGIKALQASYPNAFIICIAEWMTDPYKESIIHICNTLNCEFVDASDYKIASVVHPGIVGMMQIASQVLYPTDKTLTQKHIAADAKTVGEELTSIKAQITEILSRLN